MDQISLERIKVLHPKIRKEVLELYTLANNLLGKGCRLRITQAFRTPQEQDALFAQKPKVTNAKAWQSTHNYGLAIDIALLYDKDGNGSFEAVSWDTKFDGDKDGISDWLEVTQVFTKAGYSNGFITNGKKWDLPHFQKDFGFSVTQLKKMIDNKNTISETIDGKIYTYPNI